MTTVALPLAEVLDALGSPYFAEGLIAEATVPILAVELTPAAVGRAGTDDLRLLRALPLVTVAVSPDGPLEMPGLDSFDLLLCEDGPVPEGSQDPGWVGCAEGAGDTLSRIAERVGANPQASVTAMQLLRLGSALSVTDGLVAESLGYSALQSGPEFGRWLGSRSPGRPPESGDRSPALSVERHGDDLRISFCRPEVRNAYSHEVRDALVEALQLAAADDTIRGVTLAGEGPSFCSGGDLREFGTLPDPVTAHIVRTTRSAGWWMHRLADRIRVEIQGACIGAGVELPAFAGRVVAASDTSLALPEVGMGLVPGAGGTVSLPRRIGRRRTAYLCLTGEHLPAARALDWGLVDDVV